MRRPQSKFLICSLPKLGFKYLLCICSWTLTCTQTHLSSFSQSQVCKVQQWSQSVASSQTVTGSLLSTNGLLMSGCLDCMDQSPITGSPHWAAHVATLTDGLRWNMTISSLHEWLPWGPWPPRSWTSINMPTVMTLMLSCFVNTD